MFFFQNLTAELFLLESPDDSYFPKSGGSTFLKTVGSHFSEICGNKITAYKCVNSNLATAIRTVVVLVMAWVVVFVTTKSQDTSLASTIKAITPHSWIFLILSGLATGASWLCYFYALKIGDASKVVPVDKCSIVLTIIFAVIFLGESLTWKTVVGSILLLAGTFIMIL